MQTDAAAPPGEASPPQKPHPPSPKFSEYSGVPGPRAPVPNDPWINYPSNCFALGWGQTLMGSNTPHNLSSWGLIVPSTPLRSAQLLYQPARQGRQPMEKVRLTVALA